MSRTCTRCGKPAEQPWGYCPFCGDRLPVPARAHPSVELPADVSGPCALLRTTDGRIDIKPVGRLLAAAVKQPLADITVQIRRSKGLLAREIDADIGRRLLPKLGELGAPAILVPLDLMAELPPTLRTTKPDIGGGGLSADTTDADGEAGTITRAWNEVAFISAARVRIETSHVEEEKLGSETSRWTRRRIGGPSTREKVVVEVNHELVIDVCIGEPAAIVRIRDVHFDFQTMQRQPGERDAMVQIACKLREFAEAVPVSRAFRVLFDDRDTDAWEEYTYLTLPAVDDYNLWLHNLARLGVTF